MMQLQLSDLKVGEVKPPRGKWSNENQRYMDLAPLDAFIASFKDKKLEYRDGNITAGQAYHQNYLQYLEKCWDDHLGIVVTPDILWYTMLCELAAVSKASPEEYRHLFTTAPEGSEKQKVIVISGDPVVMPLATLVEALKDYVPTDTDKFLPDFTTSSPRSRHAFRAAFCDMCSPYYEYGMLACGFPAIDVRGTQDDYALMSEKWRGLSELFLNHKEWFDRVQNIFDSCVSNFDNASWWKEMFYLERCGSGSQTLVQGWLKSLFLNPPNFALIANFPTCVSTVNYKNYDTDKDYKMRDGLFMSHMDGDFLVPNFGFVVHEVIK